jgi:hypothetical protein
MVRVDAQLQQRCVGWVFLDVPGRYGTDAEYTVVPLSPRVTLTALKIIEESPQAITVP